MSKKERREQKQRLRDEKHAEMIKSGKAIRVHFEERKKKANSLTASVLKRHRKKKW